MRYLWGPFFVFALAACGDVDEEAGLTGSNPVVSVAYETGSYDPPSNIRLSVSKAGKLNLLAESEYAGVVNRTRPIDSASFHNLSKTLRKLRVSPGVSNTMNCARPVHRHAPRVKFIWTYRDGREGSLFSDLCTDDASADFNDAIRSFKREIYDPLWLDGLPEVYANYLRPIT